MRGAVHMQITTIGLDIAKNVFQVHGIDAAEKVGVRKQLRRGQMMKFFAAVPPCLIGMEACASAHYWARELTKLGHEVRLLPAKDVKATSSVTRTTRRTRRRSARRFAGRGWIGAGEIGRAAGPAHAASRARSSAAATNPGD